MSDAIADQLDALFAAPVRVTVAGRPVEVRGVWLCELPEFLRLYARKPADDAPDADLATHAWTMDVIGVLSQLCGQPVEWISTLDEADQEAIFDAMWRANRVLFQPGSGLRTGPRSGQHSGDSISWATAAALLIEAGHRAEDIERYTLAQIEQYMAAHARLAADRRLAALSIARAAQADAKGFRQFTRSLEAARTKLGK